MMTLAAMGYRPEDLPKTLKAWQARRRKTHRTLVPPAAAHLMVQANMNIITRAAMDDDSMYGRFLQLQRDFHQIMAGGNDGNGNGHGRNGGGQPFPSRFVSQSQVQGQVQAAPAPRAAEPPPGPDVVIDGQEYVGLDG